MNRIITMALKDIKLLLRDKTGAFFILGFPILMGLFFGVMMSGMSSGGGRSAMNICVVDQDQSEVSQQFVDSLSENDSVELDKLDDIEAAKDSVRKGNRVALLVIGKGFGDKAGVFWNEPPTIQIGVDPSRAAESAMLQGFVMESIGGLTGSRFQDPKQMKSFVEQSKSELEDDESMSAANRFLFSSFLTSMEGMVDSIDALQTEGDRTGEQQSAQPGFEFATIEPTDVTRKIDPKRRQS